MHSGERREGKGKDDAMFSLKEKRRQARKHDKVRTGPVPACLWTLYNRQLGSLHPLFIDI